MVCFAIAKGLPFVALRSNTRKIESLIQDVGLDLQIRMLSELDPSNALDIPRYTELEKKNLASFIDFSMEKRVVFVERLKCLLDDAIKC